MGNARLVGMRVVCGRACFIIVRTLWPKGLISRVSFLDSVVCRLAMASLEAALAEKSQSVALAKQQMSTKQVRLVADPAITVDSIMNAFRSFMQHHQTNDLWSLVCPPPGGPLSFHWGTPVSSCWCVKVSGLTYDLLTVAPNTKLQSVKVMKALKALLSQGNLVVGFKGRGEPKSESDAFDRIDIAVRLQLCHVRQIKTNEALKAKIFRDLSRQEQLKMELVLEKVVLPPELFIGQAVEEDASDLAAPAQSVMDPNALAIVPVSSERAGHSSPAPPPALTKALSDEALSPQGRPFSPASGLSKALSNEALSPNGLAAPVKRPSKIGKDGLPVLPNIFLREHSHAQPKPKPAKKTLQAELPKPEPPQTATPKQPAKKKVKTELPKPEASKIAAPKQPAGKTSDAALLAEALAHVPKVASNKGKGDKKKTKNEGKVVKETAAKLAKKQAVEEQSGAEAGNSWFMSDRYGQCKFETYTDKSYVRFRDIDSGKLKMIIGSCQKDFHQEICKRLIPAIKEGKSLRAEIMANLLE